MCWAGRPLHCPVENWWQRRGYAPVNALLLWWAGSARAADIRGCTITCLTVTSSHLCALPCWRGLEDSRELYQGHPSKPHMLLHQSFISLCVKLLSQEKPVIKGSLVPILRAANCSVYIFPWSLRKPAGLARCSTSLSHTQSDALQQDNGTKISLWTYLTRLVVGFGFSPKCLFLFFLNKHIHHSKTFHLIFLSAQPKIARKRNTFKSIIKAKLNKHKPSLNF